MPPWFGAIASISAAVAIDEAEYAALDGIKPTRRADWVWS
jgi:hypothetical protein